MDFSVFEALMLVCFGVSWPFALVRSYRARSSKGKSLPFLIFIDLAYLSGVLHKVVVDFDLVLILYIANFVMVSADILLYVRNTRLDQKTFGKEKSLNTREDLDII
ncbi:MAG: hypothetical protein PHO15_10995 [Eubacteriales bacterium]|nr:hypothetical protein [Eubacteriales bacterium]